MIVGFARTPGQLDELHDIVAAVPAPRTLRIPRLAASDRPLYEEVRARLIEGISAGDWRAGEAIPTESELARASASRSARCARPSTAWSPSRRWCAARARARSSPRTTAGASSSTSSTSSRATARRRIPRRAPCPSAATARGREEAAALGIAPLDKVIRIRNVLSLAGEPAIVDDITLPAELFPGLTEKIFLARDNTIYHLYQSRYGINVLRTDERLRAVLAPRDIASLLGVAAGAPVLEIRRVAPHLPRPPGGAAPVAREHRAPRLPQHARQGRGRLMQTALLILPNFVLILIGLVLARRFDFGRDFWDGLEKLVYYVLFPALLFRSLALAQIDFAATGMLVIAALLFTLAGFVLSLAPGRSSSSTASSSRRARNAAIASTPTWGSRSREASTACPAWRSRRSCSA